MKTYIIDLQYETEIEANSPEEAEEQFFKDIENEPQQTLDSFIHDHVIVKEKGKHCSKCGITLSGEYELEDQMCAQCSNEPRRRKKHISNNCKNKDEGHEFCWDKKCECGCHK